MRPRLRRRATSNASTAERGMISSADWRGRRFRWSMNTILGVTLVVLLIVGLGPLIWMVKSSITPTQDTLRSPMALFPHGFDLANLVTSGYLERLHFKYRPATPATMFRHPSSLGMRP